MKMTIEEINFNRTLDDLIILANDNDTSIDAKTLNLIIAKSLVDLIGGSIEFINEKLNTNYDIKLIDEINNGTSIQIIELEWGGKSKSVPNQYLCINGTKAYISGTIDRVEYVDNKLRIADYKSGKVEDKDLQGNILETEKENLRLSPGALS